MHLNRKTDIVIDIHNDPGILRLVIDTIPYMQGWTVDCNVTHNDMWYEYPNHTAKYFAFRLACKRFEWSQYDEKETDIPPVFINSIKEMSEMLEYIYEKGKNAF